MPEINNKVLEFQIDKVIMSKIVFMMNNSFHNYLKNGTLLEFQCYLVINIWRQDIFNLFRLDYYMTANGCVGSMARNNENNGITYHEIHF